MAGRVFPQGDVALASLDAGVLKVPVQKEPVQVPLHFRGLLTNWLLNRTEYARVNLGRLARVSYDANDRWRWFDIADQSGGSVRLLFPIVGLTEKETVILGVLRDQVNSCGISIDPRTTAAFGDPRLRPLSRSR